MYMTVRDMTPPYKRIEALEQIAGLENRTSNLLQTPYIDELENFYK